MYSCVIIFCSYFDGITDAIGPFDFRQEAEKWLKEHPSIDGQDNAKIIDLTDPK